MNKYLSNITDIFFAAVQNNDAKWGSTAAKYSKPLAKQMEKVVESLIENEANLG
jgi:ribosomal protein L22